MLNNDTALRGGIYILWISETHYYGGRTKNFKVRWAAHLRDLKAGTHPNVYMQAVYNQHGRFEPLIVQSLPFEEHEAAEQKWLTENFRKPGCVNVSPLSIGGCGNHDSKTRARMSVSAKIRVVEKPQVFTPETRSLISAQQKGRIWITNTALNECTRIFPDELEAYETQGWVEGRVAVYTEESRNKISAKMTGRVWVTDGTKNAFIDSQEVTDYAARGFMTGKSNVRPVAQEARDRSGAKRHGRVWATNGVTNLLVSPDAIPEGWVLGLTKKPATTRRKGSDF